MSRPNANTPPRAAAARASAPPWRAGLLASALIAAIVLAVFAPVLGSRALSVDDDEFVVENALVNHPGWASVAQFFREPLRPTTVGGYWMPLSMTSLMLDAAQGATAEQPLPFHRTSLALHVLATLALLWLLLLAFGAPLPAALAALVFGLHPLCVEPVAWIGERKTVLAGALALGSAALHVAWVRMGGSWRRAGAVALFALALLAKPTATPLPLLLLLLDLWPLRRFARAAVVEKWPYYVLAAASAAITLASHANNVAMSVPSVAGGGAGTLPLQLSARLCFYAGKVLWPANLACVYADAGPYAWTRPLLPLALVLVAAVLALAVLEARRRRPALLAGAGWFALALLPTLGVLHFSWVTLSDKYAYLALPGVALVLAGALAWSQRRAGAVRVAAIAVVVAALGAEATVSRATIGHWSDTLTLWRHVVAVSPGAAGAHAWLGRTLARAGSATEARAELERAAALDTTFYAAYSNLSYVALAAGDMPAAERAIGRALAIAPRSAVTLYQGAFVSRAAGRWGEAEQRVRAYLEAFPFNAPAHVLLGEALDREGRTDESISEVRRALALHPAFAPAEYGLARLLIRRDGFGPEARTRLESALRSRPDWIAPMRELAWGLATAPDSSLRDGRTALALAARASALAGDVNPGLLDTRAAAEAEAGQWAAAVATERRALALERAGPAGDPRTSARLALLGAHLARFEQRSAWREGTVAPEPPAR